MQPQAQQQLSHEQKRALSDQIGGPLQQVAEELAKCIPSINNFFSLSVEEAKQALTTARPDVFAAYEKLLTSAVQAAALSDEGAMQWKERGNAEVVQGNDDIAVINYTKGMTMALSGGVMSVLLNNRSTVFYKQSRFRDACMDANEALRIDPLYWKALERRGHCLELLGHEELGQRDNSAASAQDSSAANTVQDVDQILALLGGLEVQEVTAASCNKKVIVDRDAKGRFLVAKERLDPCQILLEGPYAAAPKLEGLFTSCAHCFKRTSSLFPSSRHRSEGIKARGLFCGERCAELSWNDYGEREKGHVFFLLCPVDALLAYRLLSVRRDRVELKCFAQGHEASEQITIDPLTDNKFGASHINSLCTFSKEVAPFGEVGGYETIVAVLSVACGAVTAGSGEQFRKAMRQVLVNAFNISSIDRVIPRHDTSNMSHSFVVVSPGKAVYSVGSLFNHSCDPNCHASWVGNPHGCSSLLSIRLIRPAMEGEELTISYNGIEKTKVHSTRGRIRALRAQYGFSCTCTACRNIVDEPVSEEDKQHYIKAADIFQKGKRLIREGNYKEAINVLFHSYDIVMRYICPPPRPPQLMLPKTHDALAQAYLLDGDKEKCVEHLRAALELDKQLNGPLYPELVRDYTRLAFLASNPKSFADESARLLELFYAPSAYLDAEVAYVRSSDRTAS